MELDVPDVMCRNLTWGSLAVEGWLSGGVTEGIYTLPCFRNRPIRAQEGRAREAMRMTSERLTLRHVI